jgi:hypothetical protein
MVEFLLAVVAPTLGHASFRANGIDFKALKDNHIGDVR